MKLTNHTRYTIKVHTDGSYSVTAPYGEGHFVNPATSPGPKLYLVGWGIGFITLESQIVPCQLE